MATYDPTTSDDNEVVVTFTAPSTWSFDPNPRLMTAAGKIKLTRAKDSTWTFVSAAVNNGGTEFTVDAPGNSGAHVIIHDKGTVKTGTWTYSVTVNSGGSEYTSPTLGITQTDSAPQIQNQIPTVPDGGFRPGERTAHA